MNSSFSELLSGDDEYFIQNRGLSDRGVPKFKSIPPPSLPISPPALSPSSYFSIPPGLSPAELLDSPILLSTSNILPSPTTGSFSQGFNWRNYGNYQQSVKQEDRNYSDFSFQPQKRPFNESTSSFQSAKSAVSTEETLSRQQHQIWNFQEPNKKTDYSSGKTTIKSEFIPIQSFSPEISTIQENTESNGGFKSEYNNYTQPSQTLREQRISEDGYNWRKYGQKQVKGSENPRSYYKCTYPNCPIKKHVERSLEGQITEIEYKGNHNHPEPQSTRRSSASSQQIQASSAPISEIPDQSFIKHNITQMESATPENSSISFGDDFDQSSQRTKSEGDEFDEDEPETKRWKRECESEGISAPGNRTVREPKVVVQTISDVDILVDGYRWRKYGQKVVKGNPNPRSYYKCTSLGCPVRKLVERASHDIRAVITTYEGKHNHDIPAARGSCSGNNMVKSNNNNNNVSMAIRPSTIIKHPNNTIGNILRSIKAPSCEGKAPFTLKMMDSPGSFGFSGFGNSMDSYMNQSQHVESEFLRAKEEVRDDMFLESLLFS